MENNTRIQIACVLLMFLILHQQQVLFVQGRHLRSPMNVGAHGHGGDRHGVHQKGSRRRVEYEVDDFRPTTPGHSPGVGHSINN